MIDFLSQGGYAFYVWSAFGMTFALLIAEALVLRRSRRTILQRVGRLARLRMQNVPPGEHR
nr:heme exporter protein CcmD [uncultured Thiohalocapsa sp.]